MLTIANLETILFLSVFLNVRLKKGTYILKRKWLVNKIGLLSFKWINVNGGSNILVVSLFSVI